MSGALSLRSGPRGSITDVEGGGFAVSERIEQSPLALVRRLVRYIRDDSTVRVRCVEQFGRAPSREQIAAIRAAENRAREALAARVEALPEKDCDALGFRPAPSGWVLREERRREAEAARRALEAARQSLRADLRERERRAGMGADGGVAADELIRMAAARHLLTHDDVVGRGRSRPVVRVRAMVCALLRLRGNSLPAIGRMLGGRDHSSVSYLLDRWREGWCDEPGLAETFDELAVLVKPETGADDEQQEEAGMTGSRKGLPRGARIPAEEARALAGQVRAALPGLSAHGCAQALGIGHRTAQALLAGEAIAASSARAIADRLDEMARLRAGATGKGAGQ